MKAILVLALFSGKAFAYSVSPMSTEYQIGSGEMTQVYTITNTDELPLSIEVRVESRTTSPDGTEVNSGKEDVTKLFSIFPKAALIAPKQRKGVRVTYVGPKDLLKEKTYRVIISQQPTKESAAQNGVKMLQEFKTTAYITPKNVKPNVELKGVEVYGRALKVLFTNSGGAHQLVKKMKLVFKDEEGGQFVAEESKYEQLLTNFLAGEERYLILEKPEALKGKHIQVTLENLE